MEKSDMEWLMLVVANILEQIQGHGGELKAKLYGDIPVQMLAHTIGIAKMTDTEQLAAMRTQAESLIQRC